MMLVTKGNTNNDQSDICMSSFEFCSLLSYVSFSNSFVKINDLLFSGEIIRSWDPRGDYKGDSPDAL